MTAMRTTSVPQPRASLGARIGGRLVDGVVTVAVAAAVTAAVVASGRDLADAAAVVLAVIGVYDVGMVAARGQTLGKMLAGTVVVDAHRGAAVRVDQAMRRWAAVALPSIVRLFVPALPLLLGTAAALAVALSVVADAEHRGLHDLVAGTRVVARR